MCLNRYYVAEGVRNYSIETWKQVFGDRGKQMVCDYAEPIAQFYISQSLADNHAVREAACHCIAEICNKVCIDDEKKEGSRATWPQGGADAEWRTQQKHSMSQNGGPFNQNSGRREVLV